MKVIRTFHPVGQGAFYSERFYTDDKPEARWNIVFDCGTSWGTLKKGKHVVSQAFDKSDIIDYLFVSHLDYDHISLLETLFSTVQDVRNIVLPLVSQENLLIQETLCRLSDYNDAASFLRKIINHINRQFEGDYYNGDYMVTFVGDSFEGDRINANFHANGDPLELGYQTPDWFFIPYNVSASSRIVEFEKKLSIILGNSDFSNELESHGFCFQTADELYDMLKDASFVELILSNKLLRGKMRWAYDAVDGGINENSLILYSGPKDKSSNYSKFRFVSASWALSIEFSRVGCLFTGDSNCDMSSWKKNHFACVWECIGTIQIPHHGSLDSFDIQKNPLDGFYFFPVSCGNNNTYGHPSGKVLAYLLSEGCAPYIITESANSVFMQRISD